MLEHLREFGNKSANPVDQAIGKMAEAGLILHNGKDIPFPSPATPVETPAQRNPEEEMLTVFGCTSDQIAHNQSEINHNTKAYVGSLVHHDKNGVIIPIFKQIGHLEHIYTSFPERRIKRETISIGGKTSKELQKELKEREINVSPYAEDMMKNKDFTTLEKPEDIVLFRLKVQDLGLEGFPTTDEIYARAKVLGLDLCPAEVGPHKRLKDTDQPLRDVYFIAIPQIADRGGGPHVFRLGRREGGLWLFDDWAGPTSWWDPGDGSVFGLSKGT